MLKKIIRYLGIALVVLFVGGQFVPYGRDHTNPPVKAEPQWDSPQTRQLFYRACRDCHSNETVWPWYSHVAPISWFLQSHIEDGRRNLNVSEWGRPKNHGKQAAGEVEEGGMPLTSYLLLHPDARLTDQEKEQLVAGLKATFGTSKPESGEKNEQNR